MAKSILLFFLLISLTIVHCTTEVSRKDLEESAKEGRTLIEIPIIGTIIFITSAISGIVSPIISIVSSLISFKVAAIQTIISIPSLIYNNLFAVVVGTAAVLGFCKMTGILSSEPTEVYEVDPRLVQADRRLREGIIKYGMNI